MSVHMKAGAFARAMDAWARGGWTLEGVEKAYGGAAAIAPADTRHGGGGNEPQMENRAGSAVRCGTISRVGFHADAQGRKVAPRMAGRMGGRGSR